MNEKLLWIWLSKLDMTNKIKLELIKKFKTIENIWKANIDDFIYYEFADSVIDKVMDITLRKGLDKEFEFLIKNNIGIVNFKEKEYPQKLLNIYDFPLVLYYKGNLKLLNENNIAIVGARMATEYGKNISRNISKQLADMNFNIISGLAIGIDKYAHLGALDSKIRKNNSCTRNRC